MDVNPFRQGVTSNIQHCGPEKSMKILDVLADEMMDFRIRIMPPVFGVFILERAPFKGGGNVSDRSIKPDIPVVTRAVRNLEPEVRCWT